MVEIFTIRIDEPVTGELYNQLLSFASLKKQKQILKYHFMDDAKRTLYGDLMMRYLISRKFDLPNCQIMFDYNECGKPYWRGRPNFYFNISHSGIWVVCAISEREIGVDIEQIKPFNLDIAKRFFQKVEYQDILKQDDEVVQLRYFYELWTLKESYIKYKGCGLSLPLNQFAIRFDENNVYLLPMNIPVVHFNRIQLDNNYKLSICSEDNIVCNKLTMITVNNFREQLARGQ